MRQSSRGATKMKMPFSISVGKVRRANGRGPWSEKLSGVILDVCAMQQSLGLV